MFHETMHLKGHTSFEIEEDEEKGKIATLYRAGVSVHSSQKKDTEGPSHEHFRGLHEAIVAQSEKEFVARALELPELSTEKEWMHSGGARARKEFLEEKLGIRAEDITWVGQGDEIEYEAIGYNTQRDVLAYVCKEIADAFPEKFSDDKAVFQEFLRAHFTGRLLPLARLIEETFGEGSFRMLGTMDEKAQSAVMSLEALKKSRLRQKKR